MRNYMFSIFTTQADLNAQTSVSTTPGLTIRTVLRSSRPNKRLISQQSKSVFVCPRLRTKNLKSSTKEKTLRKFGTCLLSLNTLSAAASPTAHSVCLIVCATDMGQILKAQLTRTAQLAREARPKRQMEMKKPQAMATPIRNLSSCPDFWQGWTR